MFAKLKFALVFAFLGCCVLAGAAAARSPETVPSPNARCVKFGGVVETRDATYNTNGGTPLTLAGVANFCRFSSTSDGNTTSIYVLLSTLNTPKPTLAALAYYAKVKYNGNCEGGPGSCYCAQLGGTDAFGGITAAGGGWVLKGHPDDVLDTCIFPDLSSIDAYGLFYHSDGVIRGRNLKGVLAYKDPY